MSFGNVDQGSLMLIFGWLGSILGHYDLFSSFGLFENIGEIRCHESLDSIEVAHEKRLQLGHKTRHLGDIHKHPSHN